METKDIIKGLVDQLSKTIIISEVTPNEAGTEIVIKVNCTYWMMVLETYTIGGERYKVIAIESNLVTLKPLKDNTPIVVNNFALPGPVYFNGTYKMVKEEINSQYKKESILPMVWLREIIEDDIDNDPESMIDRSSDIRLYFTASADYEDWLTEDHYEKVIYPMKTMVEAFLSLIKNNRFFTDVFNYRTTNLINLSVGGNQNESVFDLNLTGIELRIFAEIRKDLNNCKVCVVKDRLTVNGDTAIIPINTPTLVDVLANDDGGGSSLTLLSVGTPLAGATAEIFENQIRIIPKLDFAGLSYVTYMVTNGYETKQGILVFEIISPSQSGIQYASYESLWSGQETSYVTGDEGWRYQQGEFNSYINPRPEAYATLDLNAIDPYTTLLNDNIFRNKNRWTAPDGTQNYQTFILNGATLAIIIDHFYGMAIATRIGTAVPNYTDTLLQAIIDAPNINEQGFSGFSVAAIGELKALLFNDLRRMPPPMDDNLGYSSCSPSLQIANPFYVLYTLPTDGRVLWAGNRTQLSNSGYLFVKNIQSILQP